MKTDELIRKSLQYERAYLGVDTWAQLAAMLGVTEKALLAWRQGKLTKAIKVLVPVVVLYLEAQALEGKEQEDGITEHSNQ